jgi:hypothetical protein
LGKERQKETKVKYRFCGLDKASVNIDRIRNRLEGEKGNSHRQDYTQGRGIKRVTSIEIKNRIPDGKRKIDILKKIKKTKIPKHCQIEKNNLFPFGFGFINPIPAEFCPGKGEDQEDDKW